MIRKSILLASVFLTACGGGNNGGNETPQDNSSSFDQFVIQQINQTAEDTYPVEINSLEFVFSELEDLFDSILN